ncbi:MAG: caspase family protein, partial [Rhizobiales bacterium]|nr:caspase family protein [Hyphomicrobiales bacterium]
MFLVALSSIDLARAQDPNPYFAAAPAKRLALVVGNADYVNAAPLPGADDDAQELAETLRSLGFSVTEVLNVRSRAEFLQVHYLPFLDSIEEGSLVVFSFSGHGFTYGGESYLMPLEFPPKVKATKIFTTFLSETSLRELLNSRRPGVALIFRNCSPPS